jgi:hypothetical protein
MAAVSPQLTTRVTNILKQPAQEWPVIAAEPADVAGLMTGYAAPLSAIPAVCTWIGMFLFGWGGYFRSCDGCSGSSAPTSRQS